MSEPLVDAPVQVARVAVDLPLAHLDRLFDYRVPEKFEQDAVPGCKVRVRFSGQLRDGWLVEFGQPDPTVKAQPLHTVVSSEPVMNQATYRLVRSVADHYAGVFSDVARLAIPPRHAATEKAEPRKWTDPTPLEERRVLGSFENGPGFLDALARGHSPRAAWLVPPVHSGAGDLTGGVLEAVSATLESGRSAVVVVPTARHLETTFERFRQVLGKSSVARLSAEMGRSARYRNFLACRRGMARVVVGTRSATFTPMANLGLVVVTDDGNDAHSELRAPYPHSREVAVLRTIQSGCALLMASHSRSTEVQAFVERGWMGEIRLTPAETRRLAPPVRIIGDDPSREPTAARLRLPTGAFRFLREHLPKGPVLVQVPRVGHGSALRCDRCRNRATCPKCSGGMRMRRRDRPECSFCGFEPARWECPHCRGLALRSPIVGAARTAEELARAFPGTVAINSSGERIRSDVPDGPAIVVATPGAEPAIEAGYAGVLLLDTELMLARADLRVGEESLRRWCTAMSLCRPASEGGTVLAVGEPPQPALQAMVQGDITGYVSRELAERAAAGLPPAARVVRVGGDPAAVSDFLDNDPFDGVEVIGPTTIRAEPSPEAVVLLRTPLTGGRDLVRHVKHAAAVRSARKEGGRLYLVADPNVME